MSRTARLGVSLATRLLPRRLRTRYREEWLADLAGADEAGASPLSIAIGALLFSATLVGRAPELTGVSIVTVARRRARWSLALLSSAGVLWFGSALLGVGTTTLAPFAVVLAVVAAGFGLFGLVQLWRAARAVRALALIAAALITGGVLCFVVGVTSGRSALLLLAGLVLLAAGAVCGVIVAGSAPPAEGVALPRPSSAARGTVQALVIATSLLVLLLAFGSLELFVWGPLAQTESLTLGEIYAGLSELDRIVGLVSILVWLVFWSAAVVAFTVIVAIALRRSRRLRRRTIWSIALALAAAIVFFQFWAGFSLGMSIADTLPPYSGRISAAGYAYAFLGQLALIVTIFLVIAPRRLPVGPAGIEPTTSTV